MLRGRQGVIEGGHNRGQNRCKENQPFTVHDPDHAAKAHDQLENAFDLSLTGSGGRRESLQNVKIFSIIARSKN
jgi:hypothetical protein